MISNIPISKRGRRTDYRDYAAFGGSLGFFRKHPELPRQRGLLSKVDQATYMKLYRDGKLNIAIPNILKHSRSHFLSREELMEIDTEHYICNGNANKASDRTGHSTRTILLRWRDVGFSIRPRGYNGQDTHYHNN